MHAPRLGIFRSRRAHSLDARKRRGNRRNRRNSRETGASRGTATPTGRARSNGRGVRFRTAASTCKRLAGRLPWIKFVLAAGIGWGLVEAVASAHAYATSAPRFEARKLEFRPTPHVDTDTVRDLLGLAHGRNLLSVDLEALAREVTEHPWVARAEVTRRLPDTLIVEVEEYEPVALLAAGAMYLVDRSGRPFKRREPGEGVGLPVVTGVRLDRGGAISPSMERALEAIAAYAERPRPLLGEVHVDDDGSVTLYTAVRGTQLRLGRGDLRKALARFDALRAALGPQVDDLGRVALDAAPRDDEAWVTAAFLTPGPRTNGPTTDDASASRPPSEGRHHGRDR